MNILTLENRIDQFQYNYFRLLVYLFPFITLLKKKGFAEPFLFLAVIYGLIRLGMFLTGKIKASFVLLPIVSIALSLAFIVFLYHRIFYHSEHITYFARYFSLPFIFILFFIFDSNTYFFSKYELKRYVLYVFLLLSMWIIIDFILIKIFNMDPTWQLMWTFHPRELLAWQQHCIAPQLIFSFDSFIPENSTLFTYPTHPLSIIDILLNIINLIFGGDWRPQGLIGQPSVTSSVVIFLYLIYRYIDSSENIYKRNIFNVFLFSILTLTILLQNSGLGFVLYLAMIFLMMLTSKKKWRFIALLLPALFLALILSGHFYRISLSYIFYIWVLIHRALSNYIKHITIMGFIFGVPYPFYAGGSGYLFILSCMGIVYSLFYYCFVLKIAEKGKNKWLWLAIILLSLSDAHYTSSFYYPIIPLVIALLTIKIYLNAENYNFSAKYNILNYA